MARGEPPQDHAQLPRPVPATTGEHTALAKPNHLAALQARPARSLIPASPMARGEPPQDHAQLRQSQCQARQRQEH